MSSDCRDWEHAFEVELLGEPLAPGDRERAAAHEASCASCAAERAAWRDLATLATLAPGVSEELASPTNAFVDGVLEAFDRSTAVVRPRPRARPLQRWAWGAAGVMAAAAAAFFVVRAARDQPPEQGPIVGAHVAAASGDARVGAVPAAVAANVSAADVVSTGAGRLCLSMDPGVRVCLGPDTVASVADLGLAHRRIDVRRGHVVASLDPQPAGTSFSLSTPEGTVTAVGTEFSVDVSGSGVVARVLHGVVVVRPGGNSNVEGERLAMHEELDLATHARTLTATADELVDQALLDGTPAPTPPTLPPVAAPEPSSSASANTIAAPDVMLPVATNTAASSASAASPADLLRAARGLRGERKLTEAAQAYRKLQEKYPASDEAHASYVSLGELQLGGLHDVQGALQSFDTYLQTPGTLTQEARYGRIRALRALGRVNDETRAIRAFLADYPQSAEAPELRGELPK